MLLFPALAVLIAVLSFNLLADTWRDWLAPRTRAQLEVASLSRCKAPPKDRSCVKSLQSL